jgi:adenosine deaminase
MLERYGDGLIALGLGGPEIGNPPQKYRSAFDRMRAAGIPCILHAGETAGAESIWEALTVANSRRIGHGVRAIEDPALMAHLREQQIPLEVCSSSNICLKVFPSLAEHSLPQLLEAGLYVTLNSDDPPMFNTTLNREYLLGQRTWNWNLETIERLVLNAVDATLLPETERQALRHSFEQDFERLIQSSA